MAPRKRLRCGGAALLLAVALAGPGGQAFAQTPSLGLQASGEYMLRLGIESDIPLLPPGDQPSADTLGQNVYAWHWLRLRLGYEWGRASVRAVVDAPRGVVAGSTTQAVTEARQPRNERNGLYTIDPRWLYLEWRPFWGLVRVGQMGTHWGLGIIANDGDHESLFGDYQYGDLVERLLLATRPLGKGSPWLVSVGGDVVYRDRTAKLVDGDVALQGWAVSLWERAGHAGGLYAVYRHQASHDGGTLDALILDLYGRLGGEIAPGHRLSLAAEVVGVLGAGSLARTIYVPDQSVEQLGGAAVASYERNRLALALEGGFASGDANPLDDALRRFTMSPDHNVGLILFDEVLAWQTARAATLAVDPAISGRAAPGIQLLPTNGAVAGAAYLYPTAAFRLGSSWRLYGGMVAAFATSDVVDPYRLRAQGVVTNYNGGDPRKRTLGLELDAGLDYQRVVGAMTLRTGLQGGYFLPGDAFDDAQGRTMSAVGLIHVRAGILF